MPSIRNGSGVSENGVARLVSDIPRRGLRNIRVFADDARLLLDALTPASLGAMFVLEYLIRLRLLPDGPRVSVTATIQAYREYSQRQNSQ